MDTMKDLSQGNMGNQIGRYWEELVFVRLQKCEKEVVFFYFKADGKTVSSGSLNVINFKGQENRKSLIPEII